VDRHLKSEKVRFLNRVPLFEGLADAHFQALADLLVERDLKRGSVLFFEGDRGDALYIVRSGAVKVYRVAEDGREKTLAVLGEGEFFGEMALLDGEPRSAIAQTLQETTLYALHRSDFLELLASTPSLSAAVIRALSARLRRTNGQVMDLIFRDVRGRIARTLLDLVRQHGEQTQDGHVIVLKLTHQEIANLVGTARETVSRILAELQDAGLLRVEGRNLVLLDADELEEYASAL